MGCSGRVRAGVVGELFVNFSCASGEVRQVEQGGWCDTCAGDAGERVAVGCVGLVACDEAH